MGRRRLKLSGSVFLCVLCSGASVSAQTAQVDTPTRVEIVLPPCPSGPFDGDAFVRLVTIELHGEGVSRVAVVPAGSAPPKEAALARVTLLATPCSDAASEIDVTVDDAATTKTIRRTMALGDVPRDARPRAMALAVAELVRASWAELAMPNVPHPPPPIEAAARRVAALRAAPSPPPPPVSSPTFVALGTEIGTRSFPGFSTTVIGPRLLLSLAPVAGLPLRLRLDAGVLFGTSSDPLGEIPLGLATGGAGLLLGHGTDAFDVEIGPHTNVGWGWVRGQATAATTQSHSGGGVVADVSLALDLRVALGAGFWAAIDADAGGVFQSLQAEADGRRAAGFGGLVVGAGLGIVRVF